jgi:DNA polymerase-3 subunit epsilon
MRLLGIDLETTSLDPATTEIIEVGAVLWDCQRNMPLRMLSELIVPDAPISPETVEITGITPEDIREHGKPWEPVGAILREMSAQADLWVGHNCIRFDRPILERYEEEAAQSLPWLDTREDLPYPKGVRSRNLTYLQAAHGFVNPFAHRAVFDVLTMLRIFSQYPLAETMEFYRSPKWELTAKVSYDDRQLAKDAGFHWDADRRKWLRTMREIELAETQFDFPTSKEAVA